MRWLAFLVLAGCGTAPGQRYSAEPQDAPDARDDGRVDSGVPDAAGAAGRAGTGGFEEAGQGGSEAGGQAGSGGGFGSGGGQDAGDVEDAPAREVGPACDQAAECSAEGNPLGLCESKGCPGKPCGCPNGGVCGFPRADQCGACEAHPELPSFCGTVGRAGHEVWWHCQGAPHAGCAGPYLEYPGAAGPPSLWCC